MRKYILFSAFAVLYLISCKQKTNVDNSNIDPLDTTNMSAETISDETSLYLLVGTYTTGESEGIYVYQFDTVSGFSKYKSVVKVTNPSYLTINKEGTHVYSCLLYTSRCV